MVLELPLSKSQRAPRVVLTPGPYLRAQGSLLSSAFIDPADLLGCEAGVCDAPFSSADWAWGLIQVLSLASAYGYVLYLASQMLSEGSELLLLVPSVAGIVGSIVLPILGAVPDGAIMLFSGLGADAQEQLQVGVGALAGSTIMLLTLPWGLSIWLGRVAIVDGVAQYRTKRGLRLPNDVVQAKLDGARTVLHHTGVEPLPAIRENAGIMAGTGLVYLIIQGPAMKFARDGREEPTRDHHISSEEHW